MNQYRIKVIIAGSSYIEDPKCPVSWMGSGVYDIEVTGELVAEVDVYAHDEDEAKMIAETSDEYIVDEFVKINNVKAVSCTLESCDRDEEELGIGEIDYGEISWNYMDEDDWRELQADLKWEDRVLERL